MDDRQFDEFTIFFTEHVSRRRLGRLGASVTAVLGLVFAGGETAGKKKNKKKCSGGKERCGNQCVNVKTDNDHCGACGWKCAGPDAECRQGRCFVSSCPSGALPCAERPTLWLDGQDFQYCATKLNGEPVCARTSIGCVYALGPNGCQSDDDCNMPGLPAREVCVKASGKYCSGCSGGCVHRCDAV